MIDYLERLFFPDKREWEGEREVPAPSSHGEEQPRPLAVSAPVEGEFPRAMPMAELGVLIVAIFGRIRINKLVLDLIPNDEIANNDLQNAEK